MNGFWLALLLKSALAPLLAVAYYVCIVLPIESTRRRMSPRSRWRWLFVERPRR